MMRERKERRTDSGERMRGDELLFCRESQKADPLLLHLLLIHADTGTRTARDPPDDVPPVVSRAKAGGDQGVRRRGWEANGRKLFHASSASLTRCV